ncbi:MAG: ferritin-like domain-containing protein [Euzebyales bacterium]|nr:ferritin-like domain-containing protein [Euzebyales bacterium]MBA3620761.1 ferritin-like domain-containing protein [Euzebyales bacterium]
MEKQSQLFDGQPVIAFDNEDSRRRFLRGAALIGVGGTLAVAYRDDPLALAQDVAQSDLDILNYALTLEFLEAEFYATALDNDVVEGRELELITPIRDHEQAHVAAITQTIDDLGGDPVAKPTFNLPKKTVNKRGAFLKTASTFEELGVTAYHGQVAAIKSVDILAAAAAIAGVESRHAAILAVLTGNNPFPAPMEASRTMQEVLDIAAPFIES